MQLVRMYFSSTDVFFLSNYQLCLDPLGALVLEIYD